MAEIYGLYSGRDGKVRYVGETGGTSAERFEQHKRDAEGARKHRRLCEWLHREWRAGYPVECRCLEECAYEVRRGRETAWIANFPNLLNERKKYHRWVVGKPPRISAITEYMNRYRFNVDGFRGVHYHRYRDRFFVLIYTGFSLQYLPGDQMPGETAEDGGDVWFSDMTAAVNARDMARKSRSVGWLQLPDYEPEVYP
jgi:hypothetical protein